MGKNTCKQTFNGSFSCPSTLKGSLSNAVLRGYSAYELAVQSGFEGSETEWLESLKGDKIELRLQDAHIQWKYTQEEEWRDLADLSSEMDYNQLTNKPYINEIELMGKLTLEELGIQASGNYVESSDLVALSNSEIEKSFKF